MEKFTEIKEFVAETYGLQIIGTRKYFEGKNHQEMSAALRDLQEFINRVVVEHDKLADEVNPQFRLVGKRGRKASADAKVTTVDDVISRLTK